MKYLGYEGFHAILGGILETKMHLRLLITIPELACANPDDYGLCTLFRAYPRGVDGNTQFERS